MTITISWEAIPPELWLMILEKLPVKSQVSFACTCKAFYKLSLDPFLETIEQRAWIYLEVNKPLPDLLTKAITLLRIPFPQDPNHDIEIERQGSFIQEQISRMSNLRMLILEKWPDDISYFLSATGTCEFILQKDLDELKVPGKYLTHRSPTGKTLLHLAVEKGNVKLVDCILSQMEVYFQQEGRKESTTFSQEINLSDQEGYTPLKMAIKQENEELILLLLKKGARGKQYLLSKENTDLSPILQDTIDKGTHLYVDYLSPMSFGVFFGAVAESFHLMTLSFSAACYRELQKEEAFFQNFAEVLKRNFQRNSASSGKGKNPENNSAILLLDLSELEELTIPEIKPLFTCPGLKELLLPRSLIDQRDTCNQNLLHLLVQEKSVGLSKEIAASFISQGVALTARDHQGHTPIQLAQAIGLQTGNQEMAAFLAQAARRKINALTFGKKDWEKYFGKVGKEPPLPNHILEILESPCPIWPEKKVQDTHILTLIPEKVNGKPLTLDYLQYLVQNPKGGGNKTDYSFYSEYVKDELGSKPSGPSYWVLMTKDVLPNTRWMPYYHTQLAELNRLAARAPQIKGLGKYKTPKALEAAASILMEYIRGGVRLYSYSEGSSKQRTNTRVKEMVDKKQIRVGIGGFTASGLSIDIDAWNSAGHALGGVRKCFGC